jgi:glycosyl transferase family 87
MSAPERAGTIRRLTASARPAEIGLLALRAVVVLSVIVGVPHWPDSAAHRFFLIAHAPGIPWRDHEVEYAIGDWIVIRAVGWGSLATTRVLLAIVAFVADLAAWRSVAYGWGRAASTRYLWLGAPLLIFIYRRSDLVAVALAAAGLAFAERGRERTGGVSLAAGALTKIWPAVLAPALALERRWKALTTAVVALAAGALGWLVLGGLDAFTQVSTFRGSTGWEVGSTIGAIVWARTGEHRFENGANRTGIVPEWAPPALALLTAALVVGVWVLARRRRQRPAGAPALAAVAALLVCAPVFSPQYVAWLLPWAAVAGGRWARVAAVPIVITGALLTVWYVDWNLGPGANQLILTIRNLAVMGIVVLDLGWGRAGD